MIKAETIEKNERHGEINVEVNGSVYRLALELNSIIKNLSDSEAGQVVIHSVFANNIDKIIDSRNIFSKHEDKIGALIRRLTEIDKNNSSD